MQMPIERQEAVKRGLIELERDKQKQLKDIARYGVFLEDAAGNLTPERRQAVKALEADIRDQQALLEELREWGDEYAHIAKDALEEVFQD